MRKGLIAIIVLVVLVGAAMFFGRDTWTTAKVGTVYVAKQTTRAAPTTIPPRSSR